MFVITLLRGIALKICCSNLTIILILAVWKFKNFSDEADHRT